MNDDLPTIEEIKAQLSAGIEATDKATPGPWQNMNDLVVTQKGQWTVATTGAPDHIDAHNTIISQEECDANATFIAQSRTLCPAACRALIQVIDRLEWYDDQAGLDEVRQEWKGGAL